MEIGTGYEGIPGTGPGAIGTSREQELKQKASDLGGTARAKAMGLIDGNKEQLCQALDKAADAMSDDRVGRYAADYARRGAEFLRTRSADELLDTARTELRSRPGVMLSACFFAGLAAARMFRR